MVALDSRDVESADRAVAAAAYPAMHLAPRRAYRRERRADERVRVLGQEMDLVRPEEVLFQVSRSISERRQFIVANHNLHSLYLCSRYPELAEFYATAQLIEVDSTPILKWAKLTIGRGKSFHRCTYLDWRDQFWELAQSQSWRVFYLGSEPGVAQIAASRVNAQWPDVTIGVRSGFFDMEADSAAVVQEIVDFKPDVLLVGMGMPRQELFVVRNRAGLGPCAILTVGAAFDYEAGVQTPAPRWMGPMGVEWLYRLVRDPRRLFHRYCVEPWSLIGLALQDVDALMKRRAQRRLRSDTGAAHTNLRSPSS